MITIIFILYFKIETMIAVLEKFIEDTIVCSCFCITLHASNNSSHGHYGSYALMLVMAIILSIFGGSTDSKRRLERQLYHRLQFRRIGGDAFVYVVTTLPSVLLLTQGFATKAQQVLWTVTYSGMVFLVLLGMYLCFATTEVLLAFSIVVVHITLTMELSQCVILLLGMTIAAVVFAIIVRLCPHTFTFCETGLLSQSMLILLVKQGLNLHSRYYADTQLHISNDTTNFIHTLFTCALIIICLLSPILYHSKHFSCTNEDRWIFAIVFYTGAVLCLLMVFFPLAYISVDKNPLLWLVDMVFLNNVRIYLMLYWVLLVTASLSVVYWYTSKETNIPKTIVRKMFHVIAVLIYLPAALDSQFMSLVSAIVFVGFVVCEVIRVFKIKPFGDVLDIYLQPFRDKQDVGIVILTHVYLLFGLSFPFWIHDETKTKSNTFHLLSIYSGVISLGIGDTCAAVFGKLYGHTRWPSGQKTFLGTFSCFLSQLIFMCCLLWFATNANINFKIFLSLICVSFCVSILESVSTQIDNIILPIYTFICVNLAAIFIA